MRELKDIQLLDAAPPNTAELIILDWVNYMSKEVCQVSAALNSTGAGHIKLGAGDFHNVQNFQMSFSDGKQLARTTMGLLHVALQADRAESALDSPIPASGTVTQDDILEFADQIHGSGGMAGPILRAVLSHLEKTFALPKAMLSVSDITETQDSELVYVFLSYLMVMCPGSQDLDVNPVEMRIAQSMEEIEEAIELNDEILSKEISCLRDAHNKDKHEVVMGKALVSSGIDSVSKLIHSFSRLDRVNSLIHRVEERSLEGERLADKSMKLVVEKAMTELIRHIKDPDYESQVTAFSSV